MSYLAENVARLRKARDISQEDLAARAGVGIDTVARIERGTRTSCRPATLNRLAAALEVSAIRLLTGPDSARTRAVADTQALTRIRQAISSSREIPGLNEFADAEDISIGGAARQTSLAWQHYVAGRHTELVDALPVVLDDARRLVDSAVGDDKARAHRVLATCYRIAAGIAGRLGQEDLAWSAAERSLSTARHSDAPELQQAISLRYLAWTLVRQGRGVEAERVATRAAESIQPRMLDNEPIRATVFGNLLFNAATAAVRVNAPGRAADLLAEARSAATRTMTEVVSEAGIFSLRAVALQEIEHLTKTGDPETALQRAAGLHQAPGRLPAFWEAGNAIRLASASVATRQYDNAIAYLEHAHRLAPDWSQVQPLAVGTMRQLLDRATRRRGPRFAALATAFGLG
ncbi:helix-turn-helix domain-containing protein [Myceligenerans pegani]|uniref:Helix-turn-helix transcriptional regulator n=1 Tax=Myceligenerans pegani TaxID=2776917 RepID=A0ABR9N693_9MICO|nr:helix-turn-helix transcriptional regulator [Myceligenerans sp. TRM 65318]MBE1878706.1 helix-turn-helix transcriptional regulator [Myceligenerans sp. TRM 65318]MBE3020977.1 helix-turn-helix transcriptional regulator [Myceligenerans sp. TRM 65318]